MNKENKICECGHKEYIHGFGKRPCNMLYCKCKEFKLRNCPKEFNLSEKIWNKVDGDNSSIFVEDVKEFIQKLKEVIKLNMHFDSMKANVQPEIEVAALNEEINKLAGKELS